MEPGAFEDTMAAPEPPDAEADRARALVRSRLFGEGTATIGRYEVVERIGSGAMGIVYRGRDPALGRPVALKVLQTTASAKSATRLKVEARALAQLSHPNVVQVYEVGEDGGREFVAMELVEGEDLAKRLAQRRPPPLAVARLFLALGEGLAAAHAVDVLHRDFKPANVLVGKDGRPRIVDFGLARAPDPTPGELPDGDHGITLTGTIVGTPAYLAPELWSGARATPASDQWAYAVAMYEALFGERPFRGPSVPVLSQRIVTDRREPEPAGHAVPTWLLEIVRRGLAHDPTGRFPGMRDLVADLRRGLTRGRRRRVAAGVGVGVIAAVSVGVLLPAGAPQGCDDVEGEARELWAPGGFADAEADLRRAGLDDPTALASRVAELSDAYAGQWAGAYAQACAARSGAMDIALTCLARARERFVAQRSGLAGLDPDSEVAYAAVDAIGDLPPPQTCLDPPRFDPPADEERVARIRALVDRARVLREGRSAAVALPVAEEAAREAQYRPLLAEALALHGGLLLDSEKLDEAQEVLDRAWSLATELGYDEVATEVALELIYLHGTHRRRFDVADRWERHARARAGDALWRVEAAAAYVLEARGDYQAARDRMRTALDGAAAQLGPEHPRVIRRGLGLVDLTEDAGDFEEAQRLLDEIRPRVDALDPMHPVRILMHRNAAQLLLRTQRFDAAVREADAGLAIVSATSPDRYGQRGDLEGMAGAALGQAGALEASRARFERARELYEQAYGPDDIRVARILRNLAINAAMSGQTTEAVALAERAVAAMEATLGSEATETASSRSALGEALVNAGRYEHAVREYRTAEAVLESNLGADHFITVMNRAGMGQALVFAGDPEAGLTELVALLEEVGDDHKLACMLLSEIANALDELDRPADAEARFRRAIVRCASDSDDRTANAHVGLARVLIEQQRYAAAEAEAQRALELFSHPGAARWAAVARSVLAEARYHRPSRRREAVEMARAAREVIAEHGLETDDIDRWLETHPP